MVHTGAHGEEWRLFKAFWFHECRFTCVLRDTVKSIISYCEKFPSALVRSDWHVYRSVLYNVDHGQGLEVQP